MLDHDDDKCPLRPVHRRMDDAHRLWHQALAAYFDPEEFRVAVQNCIQTLRTVTWLLQNRKEDIPNFTTWYSQWQDRMRADTVLRWLVDARNKIEKQGDLAAHSTVHAAVVASYRDELPVLEVGANLFETVATILSRVPRYVLSKQILQHGVLRLERRWIDEQLPTHELLEALAYVFGELSLLLDDAHRQLGVPSAAFVDCNHDGSDLPIRARREDLRGRLPCMVAIAEKRMLLISLKTGEPLHLDHQRIERNEELIAIARKRYGLQDDDLAHKKEFSSLRELGHWKFDMARRVFLADGYHLPFAYLLRELKVIQFFGVPTQEQREKYMMMRWLAAMVERHGADGFILLSEVWRAQRDASAPFLRPSEMTSRIEALALFACSAAGDSFALTADIKRAGDKVALDGTQEDDGSGIFLLEPIREVWRRQNR